MTCQFCAPLPASLVDPALDAPPSATARPGRKIDVEILVKLPAATPMLDWAAVMTALGEKLGGTWSYRAAPGLPRGRWEVEVQP